MGTEAIKKAAFLHKDAILPPFDMLMDANGYEAICALCDMFGGTSVYIPRLRTIFAQCMEQQILVEYTGGNYKELAARYGFSERHIRNVIERNHVHSSIKKKSATR